MQSRLVAALCIVAIGATTLLAQSHRDGGNRKHNRPDGEQRSPELRTWFETSVYPQLLAWHNEYDASLSAEDRTALNALRVKAAALRQQRGNHKSQEGQAAKHELMAELKPIMERSAATLKALFERNEAVIEQWRAEAKAIVQSQHGEHSRKEGKGRHGFIDGLLNGNGRRAAVRFVLWNGELPAPPSKASSNVPLTDGPATIEIFDMNGSLVRTESAVISNGTVDRAFNLQGLANGAYMGSVVSASGQRRTQIVNTR